MFGVLCRVIVRLWTMHKKYGFLYHGSEIWPIKK